MVSKRNDFENFDDFSFGDDDLFGDSLGGDVGSQKSKSGPIRTFVTSFGGGMKDSLKSPSMASRIASQVLPGGYGSAVSLLGQTFDGGRKLYDEAARELKPALPAIKRAAGSLYAASEGKAPESVREFLKEFSETGEEYRNPTQEEMDQSQISDELKSVFKSQFIAEQKRSDRDRAERFVRYRVEDKRSSELLSVSIDQANSLSRLNSFNNKVYQPYLRKSLELQYRSTFFQRDQLMVTKELVGLMRDGFSALVHNTALPDYEKKSTGQAARESFRDRLLGGAQTAASKYVSGFAENITKNIGDRVKGLASEIAQAIIAGDDARSQLGDMASMMPGGRVGMAGNALGGMFAEMIAPYLAQVPQKLFSRHKRFNRSGGLAGLFLSQVPEYFNRWTQSDTNITNVGGGMWQALKELLRTDFNQETKVNESILMSADRPVPFDNVVRTTLVDVFPGYFSRMLHELQMIRTGDNSSKRIVYNMDRGRFTTINDAASDMKNRIFDKTSIFHAQQAVNDTIDKIDDGTLSPELRMKLAKRLISDSQKLTPMDDSYFDESSLSSSFSPDEIAALRKAYRTTTRQSDGRLNVRKMQGLVNSYGTIRSRVYDPIEAIRIYQQTGNVELLDELGLINNVDTDGSGRINRAVYDRIYDLMLTGEGVAPSKKESSKATGYFSNMGKRYASRWDKMSSVAAHKIYTNPTYRKATGWLGDKAEAMFDRYRRYRNGDATLDDYMNEGFAAGSAYVDGLAGQEGYTEAKVRNARDTAGKLKRGVGIRARLMKRRLKSSFKRVSDVYKADGFEPALKAAALEAGEYRDQATGQIVKTLDDIKGPVVDTQDRVVLSAQDMAKGVYDEHGDSIKKLAETGKEYLIKLKQTNAGKKASGIMGWYNGLRNRVGEALSAGGVDAAANVLSRDINDVYVAGKKHVAMTAVGIQLGEYRDQITGAIIRSYEDIKGPVVDGTGKIVLSAQDFYKGLVDNTGTRLTELTERVKSRLKGMGESASGFFGFGSTPASGPETTVEGTESPKSEYADDLLQLNARQLETLMQIYEAILSLELGGDGTRKPGLLKRGVGAMGRMGGWFTKMYGKYVKGAIGLQLRGIGAIGGAIGAGARGVMGAFNWVTGRNKKPMDIYTNARPDTPALFKNKILEGHYIDKKTEKKIVFIDDIKGPVIDTITGNFALSQEDIDAGLFTLDGKSIRSSLWRGTKSLFGSVAGYYGAVLGAPFKLAKGAINFVTKALGVINEEQDVYLKGRLDQPVLLYKNIKDGKYWSTKKGRPIRSHKEVDGEIRYIDGEVNRIAITEEEFRTLPLVNWRGKPLRTMGQSMVAGAGSLAGLAGRAAMGLVRGYTKVVGSVLGLGRDIISGTAKRIGLWFNPRYKGLAADEQTAATLNDILNLLDSRLPKPKKIRKGSWEEQFAKRKADAADKEQDKEEDERASKFGLGSMFSWLGSKAKGLFGKKGADDGEEGEDDDGGGTFIMGDPRTWWRWARRKGSRLWRKGGKALKKIPGVGKLAGLGTGAKVLGGVGAVGGGLLATYGADKAMDRMGVAEDSGARTAVDIGAGLGGGVAGAYASAKLGGMAAASLGGMGTGAAALTIGIPLAVAAGAGYMAYKGYKRYKFGGFTALRGYRLAQYGVGFNNASMVEKIMELESMLEPQVKQMGAGLDIATGRVKMDDIFKLFGIDDGWFTNNQKERDDFLAWFNYRFKPVFLKWIAEIRVIAPSTPLNEADDKLTAEQAKQLLIAAKSVDTSVYAINTGPYGDKTDLDASDVQQVFTRSQAEIQDKLGGKGGFIRTIRKLNEASIAFIPGASMFSDQISKYHDWTASLYENKSDGSWGPKDAIGKASTAAGVAVSATVAVPNRALSFINAVQAIRYKAYGLKEMTPDRVQTLYRMEREVGAMVVYGAGGEAKYDGSTKDALSKYGSMFGVDTTNYSRGVDWANWFEKRFLPVMLTFLSSCKQLNNNIDPWADELALNGANLIALGRAIIGAQRSMLGFKLSVWSFDTSPWSDEEKLNTDSKSTDDNIRYLENRAETAKLTEAAVSKSPSTAAFKGPASSDPKYDPKRYNGYLPGTDFSTSADAVNTGTDPAAIQDAQYWQSKGIDPSSIVMANNRPITPLGETIRHPGNGTGGSINDLPVPTGSGEDGVRATIEAAAKMVGVDPSLMMTMANVESAFNITAQPRAKGGKLLSSAKGLYQFIDGTWADMIRKYGDKYGLASNVTAFDPRANALMGAEYIMENHRYLKSKLGRDPTDTELYAAHFMGPGTAANFFKMPQDAIAATHFGAQAAANRGIFYSKDGTPLTIRGVNEKFEALMRRKRVESNGAAVASGGKQAPTVADFSDVSSTVSAPKPAIAPMDIATGAGLVQPTVPATGVAPAGNPQRDSMVAQASAARAYQESQVQVRSRFDADNANRSQQESVTIFKQQLQTQMQLLESSQQISAKMDTLIKVVSDKSQGQTTETRPASKTASASPRTNTGYENRDISSPLSVRRSSMS